MRAGVCQVWACNLRSASTVMDGASLASLATRVATLPHWLLLVASLRLLAVVLGYSHPRRILGQNLETQLFVRANAAAAGGKAAREFSALAARTFAVWTAVTCAVCVATAANPRDPTLLALCFATFAIAGAYFAGELWVYRTVSAATAARPAFFATVSAAWCAYEWCRL